jgi:DNA-binding NarL/FixJ family response regulator
VKPNGRKRHAPLDVETRRRLTEEVLRLRDSGLTNAEVGARLGISPRTVTRLYQEGHNGGDQAEPDPAS